MFIVKNISIDSLLSSDAEFALVLAVAITLKPGAGLTNLLIFLRKTLLFSKIGCKHIILLDARSISSRRRIAISSLTSITGLFC